MDHLFGYRSCWGDKLSWLVERVKIVILLGILRKSQCYGGPPPRCNAGAETDGETELRHNNMEWCCITKVRFFAYCLSILIDCDDLHYSAERNFACLLVLLVGISQ